jgi:uncharacterized membrane protein
MGTLGMILQVVGGIGMLVFGIQILILAFKTSVGWGLGTLLLFVPIGIIYVAKNWATCKTPFLRYLLCLVIFLVGAGLAFYGAISGAMATPAG